MRMRRVAVGLDVALNSSSEDSATLFLGVADSTAFYAVLHCIAVQWTAPCLQFLQCTGAHKLSVSVAFRAVCGGLGWAGQTNK